MEQWDREQRMVAEAFQTGMAPYQHEPLVLYGIGKNTPAVLELTEGFTFVGLLDQNPDNIGKIFFGKRVLPLEEAAAAVKRIVIIARASFVPVIYQRLRDFVKKHEISVYDFSGQLLGQETDFYHAADLEYWNRSYEDLRAAIAEHDVISFDIFDTLLGRYVLQPQDVFTLVERDLQAQGYQETFSELRIRAEKQSGCAASLDDIYAQLHQIGISEENCQDWRNRELAWEKQVVYPRRKLVEAFQYAKSLHKRIFLTSDMYLSKNEMVGLLEPFGITGYDELLISCEENAWKGSGMLFDRLLDKAKGKSVLHIGDNEFIDVAMARAKGLDVFRVYSSYDLLAVSSIQSLLTDMPKDLGDRLALGMLCAKLFEDPFALHETKGRVVLTCAEQVGYCFLGPWALSFMQWAAEQATFHGIEEFLFPSRDGFLFCHIGEIMQKYGLFPGVQMKYFKASRRAVTTASICSEEDLKKAVARKELFLTKGELLTALFRIVPDESDEEQKEHAENTDALFRYACNYLPEICEEARCERENYKSYLISQGLFNRKKSAVFDFFAAGTVQHFLGQILGKTLLGLYCARTRAPETTSYLDHEQILSAFGDTDYYGKANTLQAIYVALEALLIDGDGSLAYFDEAGNPVFQSNNGTSYTQALKTQQFICDFTDKYLSMFGNVSISLKQADQFLGILFGKGCQIKPPAVDAFIHDDPSAVGSNRQLYIPSNS